MQCYEERTNLMTSKQCLALFVTWNTAKPFTEYTWEKKKSVSVEENKLRFVSRRVT